MDKTKQQIRTEQQFLYILTQIIEAFPQYSITQHLAHFMRKKNEVVEAYHWNSDVALQKIEAYYDELKLELRNPEVDIDG